MRFSVWDCDLEKKAKAALGPTCRDDEPKAPKGKTGLFCSINITDIEPELTSAVWVWTEQIDKFTVSDDAISDKKVVYKNHDLREYLNVSYLPMPLILTSFIRINYKDSSGLFQLMRHSITKIGCAEVLCPGKDLNKYRAFCLTDKK
ncbi:hypothetical protein Y032_0045g1187 [Ancylostoma ceylanicum]|uniref:SCP domain-containing protein n=1 Tax=Ancylostoma ceylanicum TaxID=53326 RepID=A0A016UDI0_9BILA|nr:hypothetical protein Y032_0045g1187 [Ancylostoma ceylanicum]